MKKILTLILTAALLLSMTGCTYSVPDAMEYPDYALDGTPDPAQLRQTAVQAMRDILTIQWCTDKEITYRKNGPVSNKQFLHEPRNTYAGLPYSEANTGLFQFLEYYNYETGCLEYPGTADELKLEIGSSCADALLWAWSTVCNSITGGFYPVMMVPRNGYRIVGEYTYNLSVGSYNEMPSYAIIENNPKEIIMDSYAKTLPADALVSTSDNHAMMVIEAPTVVYLSDGSIDSANSYVMIQDQQAGGSTFYEHEIDGNTLYFTGRTSVKYTFDALYEKDYIPVTTAEFLGEKPYDKATVTTNNGTCSSLQQLTEVTIESNYPLAVIIATVTDPQGNSTLIERVTFGGSSIHGVSRTYELREMDGLESFADSPLNASGNTLQIEVVTATGERFIQIEFTL